MKKEERKRLKEIMQHIDLERNLPAYANAYMNAVYEYCLIHLVLNYYTIKEVQDETGIMIHDTFLSETMNQIHTLLFRTLLADEIKENDTSVIEEIDAIRRRITAKMTVLTAYTDALQIYEYVLNRVEYGITGEIYEVEESELAAKVFQYLFHDNDTMVINSKIQMVTGQLPIRMTKSRFFDYLTDTLNIYNGSDKSSVDDFSDMLKSTVLLELPQGFEDAYPEIWKMIDVLEHTEFKTLSLDSYQGLAEQFSVTTARLTELASDYLLMMEIVNDFYAALLARPYGNNEETSVLTCISMLKGLHEAFLSDSDIPENVDEGFIKIEGIQEALGEDILQYESILQDVMMDHSDTISWMMTDKIFSNLSLVSKLLSGSLFIDLTEERVEEEIADASYITAKRDELVGMLTAFFDKHAKEVNRAVMAALFSNMPVLFNSQQEIKDYIEYSLNHCGNASELMACAKILEEMMEEE